jgi:hypothetical protein
MIEKKVEFEEISVDYFTEDKQDYNNINQDYSKKYSSEVKKRLKDRLFKGRSLFPDRG